MIHLFKKLVDPIQQRAEDEERRRQREARPSEAQGDPPEDTARYRCRVCGFAGQGAAVREYCPDCLAATMVAVRSPAGDGA